MINLNIPLDKLYKIQAIGCSILFLIIISTTYKYNDERENERIKNSVANESIKNKEKLLNEELNSIRVEFKNIMNKSLSDITYLNELRPSLQSQEFNKLAFPITEQLESRLNENEKKQINHTQKVSMLDSLKIETKAMDKSISAYDSWKCFGLCFTTVLSVISLYFAYLGFKRWNYEEPIKIPTKTKLKK